MEIKIIGDFNIIHVREGNFRFCLTPNDKTDNKDLQDLKKEYHTTKIINAYNEALKK